ncbi:MAG: MarR family winged helix-turn-helix transcriptional regulator [Acidobacteriota bacterium]
MAHEETVEELVRQISMAAYRFGAAADDICHDLGVTGAMRDVLSAALASERATVPELARAMGVSRQHVQKLADQLWERGLTTFRPNPAHARSPLVELTEKGRALIETIRDCEQRLIVDLSADLPTDTATAVAVLRRLNAALHRRRSE